MPQVRPFRPITYAPALFARSPIPERIRLRDEPLDAPAGRAVSDLTDVACPPYDVIDSAAQQALLARDPHNAIRLELPGGGDPHASAAKALNDWLADGTLERRGEASAYYYAHAVADAPDDPAVQGVLARVLLEPYGAEVRAHEHTMPGPRAERLEHLRVAGAQVSPILAIYFDASERYRHVMSRSWGNEWRARDDDGLLHTLAEVEPDDRLLGYLSRQRLYIADGHHRYETALAYQAQVRADPANAGAAQGALAADWMMIVLVNAEMEELRVLPTHRLISGVEDALLERLANDGSPPWRSRGVSDDELADRLRDPSADGDVTFGLLLPGGRSFELSLDRDAAAERMRGERVSGAVGGLDVAVLQAALFNDVLGLDAAAVAAGDRLAYTRSAAEARRAVESDDAQAAVLVRPTGFEQLQAVAMAGDVMPQKSTYFYPKLLTGMAFYSVED